MQETKTKNRVTCIPIGRLIAHPGGPNRMSKRNFARLVRNIERTGLYEPLVVRRKGNRFQIINGRSRWLALRQLGLETVDAIVWDISDDEADILLCSLNRLKGSDVLATKLALLKRLSRHIEARELAKLLPFTRPQIEKLGNLKVPSAPTEAAGKSFAVPMVFFLSTDQQKIIEQALSLAGQNQTVKTNAGRNAAALTELAKCFVKDGNGVSKSS